MSSADEIAQLYALLGKGAVTAVETSVWRLIFALRLFLGGVTAPIYLPLRTFVPRDDA